MPDSDQPDVRERDIERERGKRVAIDLFFRTLADTHGPNSIGVILSGADADGALGIKRIKERGGLTIAQDPQEAEQSSMPRSAIATGMIDLILRAAEIAPRLVEAAPHQVAKSKSTTAATETGPRKMNILPRTAAAQPALVEPDFAPRGAQCVADAARGFRVLRGVAEKKPRGWNWRT